ncbi:TetR/AcrR family transcriptional regulator [Pararhizobium qamdonense]|uniref:TetR/AcrR family transcriptional regulator n=1 Tax=Pararhizobium qamdonense TaxID=3031126 RepID=UPI0023E0F1CB|nr:TetR/AcrR family transcriptional regulator [Pararhizobium qamdonense]
MVAAARLFYHNGIRATGVDHLISEAGVAKMSFYAHFPSKKELVHAFLERRHAYWIDMFSREVEARLPSEGLAAIGSALLAWFTGDNFRGCAFINTYAEFGADFPESVAHKAELAEYVREIARRLELTNPEAVMEQAMIIIEGAIIRAQMGATNSLQPPLSGLLRLVESAFSARSCSENTADSQIAGTNRVGFKRLQ